MTNTDQELEEAPVARHIIGGDVWGSYLVFKTRMGINVNTIAYIQGKEGVFDDYMSSPDWMENHHKKFKQLLVELECCKQIKEIPISEHNPKPFMIEFFKKDSLSWEKTIPIIEEAIRSFKWM
jgi:hypothetical protein